MMRYLLILMIIFSVDVNARMYQWVEPDTGTTQLSGKPPAWYRSDATGPRVLVFENGRLIDDTAVAVDDDVRFSMRQQALIQAESDQAAAKDKLARSNKLKQQYEQEEVETLDAEPIAEEDSSDAKIEAFLAEMRKLTGLSADASEEAELQEQAEKERLRGLVSDWDDQFSEGNTPAVDP